MVKMKPPRVPEQPALGAHRDMLRRLLATCAGRDFEARLDREAIRPRLRGQPLQAFLPRGRWLHCDVPEQGLLHVLSRSALSPSRQLPGGLVSIGWPVRLVADALGAPVPRDRDGKVGRARQGQSKPSSTDDLLAKEAEQGSLGRGPMAQLTTSVIRDLAAS
jgi:hypothetical protein